MKFCQKCGKELLDEAIICPDCGFEFVNINELKKVDTVSDFTEVKTETKKSKIKIILLVSILIWAILFIVACVFIKPEMTSDEIAAVSLIENYGEIDNVESARFLESFNNGYNDFYCYYVKAEDGSVHIAAIKDYGSFKECELCWETSFFKKNETMENIVEWVCSDLYTFSDRNAQYRRGYLY